jgi:hypothetical protein
MPQFEMNVHLKRWLDKQAYSASTTMPNWISQDDLVQEGRYCWSYVNQRYEDVVTEVAHMVSLFKTTYKNHLADIYNDKKNTRHESSLDQIVEDGGDFIDLLNDADVDHLILQAPEPMQTILRLLITDDQRILSAPGRTRLDGTRDTLNERLHRALRRYDVDVDPDADLATLVRRYLKGGRERLYEEPTVVEIVGALVEAYLTKPRKRKRRLRLSEEGAAQGRDKVKGFLERKAKVNTRVRIFPVVEVKTRGNRLRQSSRTDHAQARVRRGASNPKPQQQVQERAWSQVRPRVHGDWADCRYQRRQQRGDDSRLRSAEESDERKDRGAVGPRATTVEQRPTSERLVNDRGQPSRAKYPRRIAGGPQDCTPPMHPNRREPRSVHLRRAGNTAHAARTRPAARAAVRDAELLG